jgi:hypothetical protein
MEVISSLGMSVTTYNSAGGHDLEALTTQEKEN